MTASIGTTAARHFFIVGAPRAGTTWLASALASHPEIHMSPVKEPRFFAPPDDGDLGSQPVTDENVWDEVARRGSVHNAWIRDPSNYKRLLRPPAGKAVSGEATVGYLHAPLAAAAISGQFPDAHIIAILREPISRALSHLRMDAVLGRVRGSPEEILRGDLDSASQSEATTSRYLSRSLYAAALDRYIDRFGRERVLVLRFDDVRSCPGRVLELVARFLEISSRSFPSRSVVPENVGREPRWSGLNRWLVRSGTKDLIRRIATPGLMRAGKRLFYKEPQVQPLSAGLIRDLQEYFEDDIRKTERITGLDLSGWLQIPRK